MHINTKNIDGKKIVETKVLIDSGAQGILWMNDLQRNINSHSWDWMKKFKSQMLMKAQIRMDLSDSILDSQQKLMEKQSPLNF